MAAQLVLFDDAPLPGLAYRRELVTREEEVALIARIDAAGPTPLLFQGWIGKRETVSFGWQYDFADLRLAPGASLSRLAAHLPRPRRVCGFEGGSARPGAAHPICRGRRDRLAPRPPVFEHVVGISLGSRATMRFRRRVAGGFERASQRIEQRSAYHLQGVARYDWEHGIAPAETPRWSITFRSLSDEMPGWRRVR